MSATRLVVYAAGAVVAAVIVTAFTVWPRKGMQPASWGHLQTLADLVDDWSAPSGTIWWGDKGISAEDTPCWDICTAKRAG